LRSVTRHHSKTDKKMGVVENHARTTTRRMEEPLRNQPDQG